MFTREGALDLLRVGRIGRVAGAGGVILLALTLVAPSLALGLYARDSITTELAQRETRSRHTTAELAAWVVADAVNEVGAQLERIGREPATAAAYRVSDRAAQAGVVRRIQELASALRLPADATNATDLRGDALARAPDGELPPNLSDRDWFAGALSSRRAFVSDGFVGRIVGSPRVSVGVAVRDGDAPLAVLSVVMDAQDVLRPLTAVQKAPGREVLVIDRQGQVLASTEAGRQLLSRPWPGITFDPTVTTTLGDARGRMLTASPVGTTGWSVILDDDPALLFVPERALADGIAAATWTALIAALMATVSLVLLLYVLLRTARRLAAANSDRLRLATVAETTDAAIFSADEHGVATSWNPGAERLSGWTADEIIGTPLSRLALPQRQHVIDDVLKRLAREAIPPYETAIVRKDGTAVDVEVAFSALRDEEGRFLGLAAVGRDLALRREADALRAQLAALVESTAAAIIGIDAGGRIQTWNRAAEVLFGWSVAEAREMSMLDLAVPERVELAKEAIASVAAGGPAIVRDAPLRRKDGARIFAAITLSAVKDRLGRITGLSVVLRDISAERAAEDELRRYSASLEALDRQREEFLALAAHELRSPVAAMGLLADGLAAATGLNDRERQAARSVRAQADKLASLADDILAIAQLEASTLPLRFAPLDARTLVEDAADRASNARVVASLPATEAKIHGDRAHLSRALENLLNNALRYSPADRAVRVSLTQSDHTVTIVVDDEGAGLRADDIPRLFQKYVRLSSDAAPRTSGIGLGLYLARLLVEAHDGTVTASSPGPGRGATFTITLPHAAGT